MTQTSKEVKVSYEINFHNFYSACNDGQLTARHDDGRETVIRAKDCPNRLSMSNGFCSWTEVPHTDVMAFVAKDSTIKEVLYKRWSINGNMYKEVVWSKEEVSSLLHSYGARKVKPKRFTLNR